jgi:GTP-binding protein HflX
MPKTRANYSLNDLISEWKENNSDMPAIFISAKEKTNIDKFRADVYNMVAEIHAGRYPFNNFLW